MTGKSEENIQKDRVDLFPIFKTMYDLILTFELAHGQFPKLHKHTVGQKVSVGMIEALEQITIAIVSTGRREIALEMAIVELEKTEKSRKHSTHRIFVVKTFAKYSEAFKLRVLPKT